MPGLVVPDTKLAWLVTLLKKLFWWHLLQSLTSAVWQDQKSFSCPCFKHWMCFSESFQAHQPKECLFLFLLKQEPQMQGIIIFVHYLPWICKVWYSFHDFLYSTHFSLLSQIIASGSQCLTRFWTFWVIYHVTHFKHLFKEICSWRSCSNPTLVYSIIF